MAPDMKKGIATGVNWNEGDRVMVLPCLTNEKAQEMYTGFEITPVLSGKEYVRRVDCPPIPYL